VALAGKININRVPSEGGCHEKKVWGGYFYTEILRRDQLNRAFQKAFQKKGPAGKKKRDKGWNRVEDLKTWVTKGTGGAANFLGGQLTGQT